jgi:peptide/nickel transport system substrate-binding protein
MNDDREHPYVPTLKRQLAEGRIDRREFLRTATLLGVSAGAAYALVDRLTGSAGMARAQDAALPKGGTIRIAALVNEVKSPHTFFRLEQSNVVRQVCDYVTTIGADNVTRPSLAESWEVSPDLKTWTLRLRKDVKWRKGRDFTADDLIWNLRHVLDPAVGSSVLGLMKGFMLEEIETGEKDAKGQPKRSTRLWDASAIERVDAHTVRLNAKLPHLAVPEDFFAYQLPMLDPEENGVFDVGSNGTGAFELVDNQPGRRMVLKARKSFWGGAANIDQLEFIAMGDDPAAAISALAGRQIDGMTAAGIAQYNVLRTMPHLEMYEVPTASGAVVRGKFGEKPFGDLKFRRALQLATDTKRVMEIAYRGLGRPGEFHHVAPIHPEYAALSPLRRDVAAAKLLLAEAGYPEGIDLKIDSRADPDWFVATVEALIEQWKEAGIRVAINLIPSQQYAELWNKVAFGVTDWFHRPLGVQQLSLAYRAGVPWNETGYSNPAFDTLLDEAEATLDVETRRAIMAKLERIMQDDAIMILPFWRSSFTFMDKKVKGFRMHPSQYIFGHELAIEA